MNMVIKNRVVGAVVLFVVAILALWLFIAWAQSGAPSESTHVRVYEIDGQGDVVSVNADTTDKPGSAAAESHGRLFPKNKAVSKTKDNQSVIQSDREKAAATKPVLPVQPSHEPRADIMVSENADAQSESEHVVKQTAQPRVEPSSQGSWVIQIGSFKKRTNAQDLKQQVADEYSVSIVVGLVSGTQYHRVRVGPFNTAKAAHDAKRRLRQAGYATQLMYTD